MTDASDRLTVTCKACGHANVMNQPYPYHAGFGDTAFLYNDAGNLTLTWGTYDDAYAKLLGKAEQWQPPEEVKRAIEARLPRSPAGDRWRFANPARCAQCTAAISEPMSNKSIYYLEFAGSIILGRAGTPSTLGDYLLPA